MDSERKGWCGRGDKPRKFHERPIIRYRRPPKVNANVYADKRYSALTGETIVNVLIPKCSARAWRMLTDDLCRITLTEDSQVGSLNLWNLQNTKEHFYSGVTCQLHSAHLTVFDRLWSNIPYVQPMATIVADSIKYGIDSDGAGCHDVIGSLCDDYTYKAITGKEKNQSCYSQLKEAIKEFGLDESGVHNVWNIFKCTGYTKDTHQYFTKASPSQKGDYIDFIADMDLIVALSACPQGDESTPIGQDVPEDKQFPLGVEVFRPNM